MKKIIRIILCLVLVFGLTACSSVRDDDDEIESKTEVVEAIDTADAESVNDGEIGKGAFVYENVRFSAIYQVVEVEKVEQDDGSFMQRPSIKDNELIDTITTNVRGDAGMTVLDGVAKILEANKFEYDIDFSSIVSIEGHYEVSKNGYLYIWEYTINGKKPAGRACDIPLESNMEIVYILTAGVDISAH